jgi:hypothetical protein
LPSRNRHATILVAAITVADLTAQTGNQVAALPSNDRKTADSQSACDGPDATGGSISLEITPSSVRILLLIFTIVQFGLLVLRPQPRSCCARRKA